MAGHGFAWPKCPVRHAAAASSGHYIPLQRGLLAAGSRKSCSSSSCAVTVDLCHIPPNASLQLDVTTFATWRFSFAIVAFATVTTRKAWLVKNRGKGSEWNGEREKRSQVGKCPPWLRCLASSPQAVETTACQHPKHPNRADRLWLSRVWNGAGLEVRGGSPSRLFSGNSMGILRVGHVRVMWQPLKASSIADGSQQHSGSYQLLYAYLPTYT